MTPSDASPVGVIRKYFRDFSVLKDNPREFWAIQAINFLDCMAYFAFFYMVTVFLTDDMGWTDVPAGYIFTAFTLLVTFSLPFMGFVTDALGIRRSLYISMGLSLLSRGGLAACGLLAFPAWTALPEGAFRAWAESHALPLTWQAWAVIPLFLLASPAQAMAQTLFQAANRRYSTQRSRSASFNAWYFFMNGGAVMAGVVIDVVRKSLGLSNGWIYAFSAATAVACGFVVLAAVRKEEQAGEPVAKETTKTGSWSRFLEMLRQESFWKFLVLTVVVLGVRAVFLYSGMIMPKYWLRVIGDGAPVGLLETINPLLVMGGVFLMIPITGRFNVFKMLVVGAAVSASSLAILTLPWSWFGSEVGHAYVVMSIVMMSLLTLGELLWSPRLLEYTAAIAPKGMEGSYLGLSMVPYFLAKTVVSSLSGHMLARWCPEGVGDAIRAGTLGFWDAPEAMWLVLLAWAASGPILALLLSGWLTRGVDLDPVGSEKKAGTTE